jgi:hypothetical protein
VVDISDVLVALARFGLDCTGPQRPGKAF